MSTFPFGLLALLVQASASTPHDAAPFEVVRTWTGERDDHLGIGVAVLGDVDADGIPELILGATSGGHALRYGPGHARVVSGRDGSLLYMVRGTQGSRECGDAFGDTITALGDVDGDTAPDFAVGAWRYGKYRGYATVYSGRAGTPLATIYRDGRVDLGQVAVPAPSCEVDFAPGLGGSLGALRDVDSDGVSDFVVGGWGRGDAVYVVSGRSLEISARWNGVVVAPSGDVDGDGRAEILCWNGEMELRSDAGILLETLPLDPVSRFDIAGDLDSDGFPDLVVLQHCMEGRGRVRVVSGRSGAVLSDPGFESGSFYQYLGGGALGDIDADGTPDYFVRRAGRSRPTRIWLVSGRTARVLGIHEGRGVAYGSAIVPVGDMSDVGRSYFLLSDPHQCTAGGACGGAVHLVRLRSAPRPR